MNQIIPLSKWEDQGNVWPTQVGWYNMLRPDALRDELIESGVVTKVNGRWLIFPDEWRTFCAKNHGLRAA